MGKGKEITVQIIHAKEHTLEHAFLAKDFGISTQDVQNGNKYLVCKRPQKEIVNYPLEMGGESLLVLVCHII